ncbi:Chymotrypsin-like elastase family member 1 [Orchesella cincta]|uniref:Chymotrypsin-like elastase family member 1 n=1 Tax=Orchesella cincta TaxID=48709 RepID=A0A1D2MNE2_ORCCI|nr:Chymotrypsin-like elastase family member 1 [Orchesella cincta]
MKFNLILVSIGLCAFLIEPAFSRCTQETCLPPHFGCDKAVPGHAIPVSSPNKNTTCTVQGMAGTLVKCCSNENEANKAREKYAMENQIKANKALAKAIMGAEENEYPHQIQLKTRGTCGGTVYNKNWIITAAHCRQSSDYTSSTGTFQWTADHPVEQAYVIAGTSHVADVPERNKYPIDKVIWHEDWKPTEIGDGYDIALLHLAKPLALEKGKIQPLRLEPAGFVPNYGGNGVVIGFGNVDKRLGDTTDDLMETVAPIHHKATGNQISFDRSNDAGPHGKALKSMTLAIGGGDSGVVVGQAYSLRNCFLSRTVRFIRLAKKPSYYQRVEPMLSWIQKNVGGEAQEEALIFDEPLFPEKIPDKDVHPSLVRISHGKRSCSGVLVTRKMILTTGECAKHDGLREANPVILHLRTETALPHKGAGENDLGFIITDQVPAEYVVKMAPEGYQMKGRSVEYTFNQAVNSVEKRNYWKWTRRLCFKAEVCGQEFGADSRSTLHATGLLCRERLQERTWVGC